MLVLCLRLALSSLAAGIYFPSIIDTIEKSDVAHACRPSSKVKTFKRDNIRAIRLADVATALDLIENWMEDYNTVCLHSRPDHPSVRLASILPPNPNPPHVRSNRVNSSMIKASEVTGALSTYDQF